MCKQTTRLGPSQGTYMEEHPAWGWEVAKDGNPDSLPFKDSRWAFAKLQLYVVRDNFL